MLFDLLVLIEANGKYKGRFNAVYIVLYAV